MQYKVELIKSEEGYAVGCPALPGCWSQGETEQEALANIRAAIGDYLAAQRDLAVVKRIYYVDVPQTSSSTEFDIEPVQGLEWPEYLHHTDKASEWIDLLESKAVHAGS